MLVCFLAGLAIDLIFRVGEATRGVFSFAIQHPKKCPSLSSEGFVEGLKKKTESRYKFKSRCWLVCSLFLLSISSHGLAEAEKEKSSGGTFSIE